MPGPSSEVPGRPWWASRRGFASALPVGGGRSRRWCSSVRHSVRDSVRGLVGGRSAASGAPGIGDDPTDTREEEEEDLAQTVEDATTEDLALLLETSPLDLSRLSAVRPQIVLPGTSAWILIRNPAEVDRYMNYANGENPEVEGLVDVAVWIDEWGSVEWAEISRSSGRQEMDEIALALFNEVASFRPARDRGVRVSLSAIFSVPFPW